MSNKEIARAFQLLGSIMELHDENPFKIRSYQNAYRTLRKLDQPLANMTDEQIATIKGVGKAIAGKIRELLNTGKMQTLERYRSMTPEGVQEMLNIKGFGPKKIRVIWKDLGVESIGELLYAVNENRLIELKGFGKKTQDDLRQKLEYYQRSRDKFHYAALELAGEELVDKLRHQLTKVEVSLTGAIRRRCNILERIEILLASEEAAIDFAALGLEGDVDASHGTWEGHTADDQPVRIYRCAPAEFGSRLFQYTAAPAFEKAFEADFPAITLKKDYAREEDIFSAAAIPFIEPELREEEWALELARKGRLPDLLREEEIRGVLHAHSTYSDGLNALEDMARYAREQGYSYLGITDHSRSAFYANGLQPERVIKQMEEVDQLNTRLAPFRIFKGIESDILGDGSLDYDEEILQRFDFVIASIHSNLRMDEDKATQRLIRAIENPYTRILGHPTGRLLLSRRAYPIDHQAIIDACAAHDVVIELNANPYRLDLDWTWIPYAIEKGVKIAVNPDAHSREGIHDIHYGVLSARKGGLTRESCLNCLDVEAFTEWCHHRP